MDDTGITELLLEMLEYYDGTLEEMEPETEEVYG